ncbi:MAG: T9SS type A sorting domain-containing protein [Flavobacteriales bacterium]|nr:T9SS type A sorting domain-containing protein [Flavobacteriales bacterium]
MSQLGQFIACILVVGILTCSSLSAQLTISDPISVTQGDNSFGKKSPKLALNANGELMVFWMRTGNEAFFISTLEAGFFSTPNQILFGGINPNLWSGSLGPNMASTGDNVYVTFEVYGDAIYVVHSADGGQSWGNPVAAFIPPQGRRATIPTIAVDTEGHPYIVYVNTNASEGDAHYGMVRSNDFGLTFTDEVDVSENADGDEVCECCNGHIEIAPNGDVYVAFRNNNANLRDIWLARSTDDGASFSSAFDVDETDWISGVCPSNGPHFTMTEDQIVTTFFSGTGSGGSGVYYSTYDIDLSAVGPTIDLPLSNIDFENQNRPRIHGNNETLAMVWQENTDNGVDIAMSVSTSGPEGLTAEPFILASLASTQQFPSVIFDGERFHVVYEDNETGTLLYQEVIVGAVGLNTEEVLSFEIQPNPSSDVITITRESSKPAEMHIVDLQGKIMLSETIADKRSLIDISYLRPGIYSVTIIEQGRSSFQRLQVLK